MDFLHSLFLIEIPDDARRPFENRNPIDPLSSCKARMVACLGYLQNVLVLTLQNNIDFSKKFSAEISRREFPSGSQREKQEK